MGDEGLEPNAQNTEEHSLFENSGHPGGHFGEDSEMVASLKARSIFHLNQALSSLLAGQDIAPATASRSSINNLTELLNELREMPPEQILG